MPLRRPPLIDPAADPSARTVNIWYVQRELGVQRYSDKRLVAYVGKLVEAYGFPAPLPAPRRGSSDGELTTGVTTGSRWQRAAVDAWFDGQLPPGATEAIDRRAHAAAADAMDSAARNLRLVGGRDYQGDAA